MALAKFYEDIVNRRLRDGAQIIFDDYAHLAPANFRLSEKGQELKERAASMGMTRVGLLSLRRWVQQALQHSTQRLNEEKAVLYSLNDDLTRVVSIEYASKMRISELSRCVSGDLLSLDDIYDGLMVWGKFIIVSEAAIARALRKFGSDGVLTGLINEQAVG